MSLNTSLDVMVLLGDSITEGSWAKEGLSTRLAEFYVRKLDVINRGYGGFNTRDLLPIAENIFRPTTSTDLPKVRQITVFLGANDAVLFGPQLVGELNLSASLPRPSLLLSLVSTRRAGVPPRGGVAGGGRRVVDEDRGKGSSNVGQVGVDEGGGGGRRSRIPEPPSTGRERLRPTSYHHDGSTPRRPILEPPSSYSSSRNGYLPPRQQHQAPSSPRQSSTIPTRRPSQRHRSIRPPSSSTQPHRSRGVPSKSLTHFSPSLPSFSTKATSQRDRRTRPPLPHLSSSESLLRVTIPATSALGLTYRGPPPPFQRGGETSSSESGLRTGRSEVALG